MTEVHVFKLIRGDDFWFNKDNEVGTIKKLPVTKTIQPPKAKRAVKVVQKKLTNEVAFVLDASGSMSGLAECEMPEGQDKPDEIPEYLQPYILYEVPRDDRRFDNTKLGDVVYAKEMYRVLKRSNDTVGEVL